MAKFSIDPDHHNRYHAVLIADEDEDVEYNLNHIIDVNALRDLGASAVIILGLYSEHTLVCQCKFGPRRELECSGILSRLKILIAA